MKNFAINSFVTAAAVSLAAAFSGHAAADVQDYAAADELSGRQLQLETIRSLDFTLTERVFIPSFTDAIEEQDVRVNSQAQSRAEALYRTHNYAGSESPLQTARVDHASGDRL